MLKSNYFFNYLSMAFIDKIKKCLAVNIAPTLGCFIDEGVTLTLDRFIDEGDDDVFSDKTRLEIAIQL